MSVTWTVYVEGGDDRAFLDSLLNRLDITNVEIDLIGGGVHHLRTIKPNLRKRRDAGNQIAVVLDANSDFSRRSDELLKCKDRFGLPIDRFFLLPNHSKPGSLETLLERMAVTSHRRIYECFDNYRSCLQHFDESYILPNPKARIYAYCEALGENTRGSERDYSDPSHWNLDVPVLNPLKQFLCDLRESLN